MRWNGIPSVDINNIVLDDANFYEDDPSTITHVRHVAWCDEYIRCKAFKKELSKELMLVAWHPEDGKKELFFIDEK